MWYLLLSALAAVPELPPMPERPARSPVQSADCARSVPMVKGEPLPDWLLRDGVLACSAILVPSSDVVDLLAVEAWAESMHVWGGVAQRRHQLDTAALQRDLDWTMARLEIANKPPPWGQRPAVNRTIGRVETLVTLAAIGGVVYGLSRGMQ